MKRLGGWDVLLLTSETPNVHQHTLKIAVVDAAGFRGEPTFAAFRDVFSSRLPALDPLRYRLTATPFHLHRPVWHENADVDLDYHVRHVHVPSPGGRRELDALIGRIASTPLDRRYPLWRLYFADGLADDGIAVIGKVHHVLADGVASANLMARAMEWPGTAPVQSALRAIDPAPTTAELLMYAARDHLSRMRSLPSAVPMGSLRCLPDAGARPAAGQQPDLAARFDPPATFLNHKLTPGRTFASVSLSLDDAKRLSKSLQVTINEWC